MYVLSLIARNLDYLKIITQPLPNNAGTNKRPNKIKNQNKEPLATRIPINMHNVYGTLGNTVELKLS